MDTKKQKPEYVPPVFRDLSGISASGTGGIEKNKAQGMCLSGSTIQQAECTPTGTGPAADPASCAPSGLGPSYGYCSEGNGAIEGCTSGGNQVG